MIQQWREFLYPLGYIAGLIFGLRFLLQWIFSEIHKKSVVKRSFWSLSLIGNTLMMLHGLIQVQFHVALIQVGNAIIAWRHLDFFKPISKQKKFTQVIYLMIAGFAAVIGYFICQSLILNDYHWFHSPKPSTKTTSLLWHSFGFSALILFASRFWVQWWLNEKHQSYVLGTSFWWLSLSGNIACLIYFIRINDPVNFIGPAFNFIPCIRNLMMLYQNQEAQ